MATKLNGIVSNLVAENVGTIKMMISRTRQFIDLDLKILYRVVR